MNYRRLACPDCKSRCSVVYRNNKSKSYVKIPDTYYCEICKKILVIKIDYVEDHTMYL